MKVFKENRTYYLKNTYSEYCDLKEKLPDHLCFMGWKWNKGVRMWSTSSAVAVKKLKEACTSNDINISFPELPTWKELNKRKITTENQKQKREKKKKLSSLKPKRKAKTIEPGSLIQITKDIRNTHVFYQVPFHTHARIAVTKGSEKDSSESLLNETMLVTKLEHKEVSLDHFFVRISKLTVLHNDKEKEITLEIQKEKTEPVKSEEELKDNQIKQLKNIFRELKTEEDFKPVKLYKTPEIYYTEESLEDRSHKHFLLHNCIDPDYAECYVNFDIDDFPGMRG